MRRWNVSCMKNQQKAPKMLCLTELLLDLCFLRFVPGKLLLCISFQCCSSNPSEITILGQSGVLSYLMWRLEEDLVPMYTSDFPLRAADYLLCLCCSSPSGTLGQQGLHSLWQPVVGNSLVSEMARHHRNWRCCLVQSSPFSIFSSLGAERIRMI